MTFTLDPRTPGYCAIAPKLLALCVAATLLTGCATPANNRDPLEGFNRAVFAFNDGLDMLLIKPVAQGYDTVVPAPVRNSVTHFFGNIADVFIGVNNLLQGKPAEAVGDFGRVLINSTVGILGLIDVASGMGLEKHDEDFGQTLGRWGAGDGAYLVLPLFGPRSVRDTVGLVLDVAVDPIGDVDDVRTYNSLTALRLVDTRADLLPADKVVEEAALDRYAYIRDGYLQRRRNLVYDGNAPRLPDDE